MAKFQTDWLKLTGPVISDPGTRYGVLDNIPSYLVNRIFFGLPEVEIEDPSNYHGAVYKVLYLDDELGITSIRDIDTYWDTIVDFVNNYNKDILWDADENCVIYNHEPFVVSRSCVILYGDTFNDGSLRQYDHEAIVLIDEQARPKTLNITAEYIGETLEIDSVVDKDKIKIKAHLEDGTEVLVDVYSVAFTPDSLYMYYEGVNTFYITYIDPEGNEHQTYVNVNGIKKLVSITATYDDDGPKVAEGTSVDTKYITVIGNYSDGSSATITGYTFPDGDIVTTNNLGVLRIYYKGYYDTIVVPMYRLNSARLIVYYNGPDVEVGHQFIQDYVIVKVFYQGDEETESYYEDIDPASCTFEPLVISDDKSNEIKCIYDSKVGEIYAYFVIQGFIPSHKPVSLEVEYTGPEIVVGKSYNIERVKAKCHYSDGTVETLSSFSVNSNIVTQEGENTFTAYYTYELTTISQTFTVTGIPSEDTTESNYSPVSLDNNFPKGQRINNRYRGPAEARKQASVSMAVTQNLSELYNIFANIEQDFNAIIESTSSNTSAKTMVISHVQGMNDVIDSWHSREEYTKTKYIGERV